jgi:hypothetical protein
MAAPDTELSYPHQRRLSVALDKAVEMSGENIYKSSLHEVDSGLAIGDLVRLSELGFGMP